MGAAKRARTAADAAVKALVDSLRSDACDRAYGALPTEQVAS